MDQRLGGPVRLASTSVTSTIFFATLDVLGFIFGVFGTLRSTALMPVEAAVGRIVRRDR